MPAANAMAAVSKTVHGSIDNVAHAAWTNLVKTACMMHWAGWGLESSLWECLDLVQVLKMLHIPNSGHDASAKHSRAACKMDQAWQGLLMKIRP